jgi:hypothetical protein
MEWLGHAGPVLGALIAGLAVEQFGINVPEPLTNLFFLMFVFALGPALVGAFKAFAGRCLAPESLFRSFHPSSPFWWGDT